MSVFVVIAGMDYESNYIVGIFKSLASARSYLVQNYRLKGEGWNWVDRMGGSKELRREHEYVYIAELQVQE